jgi:hypothetical protein
MARDDASESRAGEAVPVVTLDPNDPETRRVWADALTLMGQLEGEWTLIGGLMVQLHAERYGQGGARPTADVDILANSRTRPSMSERISKQLTELDFRPEPPAGPELKTVYRFTRGEEIVDVLAPDGERTPPRTIGTQETVQISGGTQALRRSEEVTVALDGNQTTLRVPSLLGAILLKSRAIMSPQRDQDREDLIRLLLCIEDFDAIRAEIKKTERKWLTDAGRRLAFDDPDLTRLFSADEIARARAAHGLLTRPETPQRGPA